MTTEDLMKLRELAEDVRDAELPHPKWLAENAFKAAFNYGTAIELLDALEAQGREVARLTVERDVNKRMRDQHFAELEDVRSQVATINAGFNNVQTDRDQIAAHRDHIAKVNDTLRAELEAIRAQEPVASRTLVHRQSGEAYWAYLDGVKDIPILDRQPLYAAPVASPDVGVLVDALRLENFAADGWANSFYNALQHVKNLRDGITDFNSVLKNLDECEKESQRDWQKANARAAITQSQAARVPDASPAAKDTGLVAALKDAATSLETISRLAGRTHYVGDDGERVETYMGHHDQVRGYATSRASVARDALSKFGGV